MNILILEKLYSLHAFNFRISMEFKVMKTEGNVQYITQTLTCSVIMIKHNFNLSLWVLRHSDRVFRHAFSDKHCKKQNLWLAWISPESSRITFWIPADFVQNTHRNVVSEKKLPTALQTHKTTVSPTFTIGGFKVYTICHSSTVFTNSV